MKSPILFLIFNRPDTTQSVFERIREVRPPRLYIAADGPRETRPGEHEKCEETRKITENVDWPCEVHRLYRDKNLGCGKGVSSAITWFFEQEEEGIIIEDDIMAHPDFFRYCDEMLEKYRTDDRIQLIAGRNAFYQAIPHTVSYYLSNYMMIWGWASWRRVWNTYCFDVATLSRARFQEAVKAKIARPAQAFMLRSFDMMANHQCDTWDYQLIINQVLNNRYAILPYVNMVENLGLGTADATHTTGEEPIKAGHKAQSPYPLVHPDSFFRDEKADYLHARNEGIIPGPLKRIKDSVLAVLKELRRK